MFGLAHVTTPLPTVVDNADENIHITAENGQQVMLSIEGLRDLYGLVSVLMVTMLCQLITL